MELRELLAYCVDLFIMLRKLKILCIIHNAYLVILLLVCFAKIESRSLFLPYLILISHILSPDTETLVLFKILCSSIVYKYTSPFSLPTVWSQWYMLCSVLCGCNPMLEITLSCSTCLAHGYPAVQLCQFLYPAPTCRALTLCPVCCYCTCENMPIKKSYKICWAKGYFSVISRLPSKKL